jgi:hypothetical protein
MKLAALASVGLVLPFMTLEWIYRRDPPGAYPVALFAFMWALSFVFLTLLIGPVRKWQAGQSLSRLPIALSRIALALLIGWFWIGLVVDQMPCFLGVPHCD